MAGPIFYGSPEFTAAGNVTLVDNSFQSDPASRSYSLTWKGTEAAVDTLATAIALQGARVSRSKANGQFTVTGTYSYDPTAPAGNEVPRDTYSFSTETTQVDIYSHPRAEKYLMAAGVKKQAAMRAAMEQFVGSTEAKQVPVGSIQAPFFDSTPEGISAGGIFDYRYHGGTHYNVLRPIFRRRREYSLAYAPRRVIQNQPTFYSRASLISTYSIPAEVAAQIPEDPADAPPTGTVWGWRKRMDDAEITQTKRGAYVVQETLDFEFAYFFTFFFDQV
jgi:hypothetical protein